MSSSEQPKFDLRTAINAKNAADAESRAKFLRIQEEEHIRLTKVLYDLIRERIEGAAGVMIKEIPTRPNKDLPVAPLAVHIGENYITLTPVNYKRMSPLDPPLQGLIEIHHRGRDLSSFSVVMAGGPDGNWELFVRDVAGARTPKLDPLTAESLDLMLGKLFGYIKR